MSYNYTFGIFQLLSVVRVVQYLVFCVVFYEPLFFSQLERIILILSQPVIHLTP